MSVIRVDEDRKNYSKRSIVKEEERENESKRETPLIKFENKSETEMEKHHESVNTSNLSLLCLGSCH